MEQERKLRIISLDESGEFERFLSDDIRFIGGLIIDKPLPENAKTDNIVANVRKEIRSELTRLTDEYNRLLEEKGFLFEDKEVIVKYPESLHMSDSNTYYSKDGVGIKKAKLEKKLRAEEILPFSMWMKERSMEFIKEMGYGIYAYIYPFGDNFINVEGVESNLGAADYASHLYSRMSTVSMFNTVFYMFDDSFTDYSLQFAQRSLVFSGLTNDREREVNQGLSKEYAKHIVVEKGPNDREKKSTIYTITNVASYRTSLTDEIYSVNVSDSYKNKGYYMDIESIDYSGRKDMAIHYLTDILCSYIRNTIDRINGKTEIYNDVAETLRDDLQELIGEGIVDIRFYSKADAYYRNIYRYYMLGNLAKAFDAEFDFRLVSSSVDGSEDADYVRENILSKYYEVEFLPKLDDYQEVLLQDERYYSDVITRFDEFVSYAERFMGKDGNFGYSRGLYIAERLYEYFDKMKTIEMDKSRENRVVLDRKLGEITFRLNDIIMRGLNHRGVVRDLLPVIDTCKANRMYVSPVDYINFKTRAAQYYFNSFEFEKVKNLFIDDVKPGVISILENKTIDDAGSKSLIEQLEHVYAGLTGIESGSAGISGKIYSTLGQAYGFMGDYDISEKWFIASLEKWSGDLDNQNITLSYLMNLYADSKNREGYEKYAKEYFGYFDTKGHDCGSAITQLEVLRDAYENRQFIRYALAVYVKAFYNIYLTDASSSDFAKLKELIYDIETNKNAVAGQASRNRYDDTNNDPWQRIYKYLYLIAKSFGDEEVAAEYAERVFECVEGDATISVMQLDFELLLQSEVDGTLFNEYLETSRIDGVKGYLQEFPCFDGILDMTVSEAKRLLETKLNYMYR
ncbi:MAG: hypothetical protein ILA13_07115 [Eubacterium sp.]|nr:hypothetical protein [Eubacterium sp.]